MDVEWLESAVADLERIVASRSAFGDNAGRRLLERIIVRTEQLAEFPNSGRVIPETGTPLLRELIEEGYRIMYEVFPDRVEVWAIAHAREDLRRGE